MLRSKRILNVELFKQKVETIFFAFPEAGGGEGTGTERVAWMECVARCAQVDFHQNRSSLQKTSKVVPFFSFWELTNNGNKIIHS